MSTKQITDHHFQTSLTRFTRTADSVKRTAPCYAVFTQLLAHDDGHSREWLPPQACGPKETQALRSQQLPGSQGSTLLFEMQALPPG